MNESEIKAIAHQLSCPQGEAGIEIGNKMNALNAFITSRTIEVFSPKPNEVIAELGPGNGALSESMVHTLGKNGCYYGIEPSDVMAEEARHRLSANACTVDIHSGDHMSVDIGKSSLDGIMAVNVLYFIEDLDAFFNRIISWMKPDARAVFGIRSDDSLRQMPFTQYGFNIRSPDTIKSTMQKNGFSNIESSYYDEGTVVFGDTELPIDSVIISGKI